MPVRGAMQLIKRKGKEMQVFFLSKLQTRHHIPEKLKL